MVRLQIYSLMFYMSIFVVGIASDGKIFIKLVHFENRESMTDNGLCCDGYRLPGVCNYCEYNFAICVSDVNTKTCSIGNYRTYSYFQHVYITFKNSLLIQPRGTEISNPMEFTFSKWNGTIFFGITVYDEDSMKNDLITKMARNITINATEFGSTVKKGLALEGKRRIAGSPKLTAEISVNCMENYLIPSCEEYCVDTNDATGHYKCNYTTGTRKCLPGWHGDKCNNKITYCTPRNDSQGHYMCDNVTGEKICLPGWKNVTRNCTEAIIIQRTDSIKSTTIHQQRSSSSSAIMNGATTTLAPSTTQVESSSVNYSTRSPWQTRPVITTSYMITTANLSASVGTASKDIIFIATTQSRAAATPMLAKTLISSSGNLHESSPLADWHAITSYVQSTFAATAKTAEKESKCSSIDDITRSRSSQSHMREKATVPSEYTASKTLELVRTIESSTRRVENVLPMFTSQSTKKVKRTSSQPTVKTTKPKENDTNFDFSKLIAIGLSTLIIVALLISVVAVSIRKTRMHRVQPINLSERYKQSSARFTESRKSSSFSLSNTSAPSIRVFDERRAAHGQFTMHEHPSSSARGCRETRSNPTMYMMKIEADNQSAYLGKRSHSLHTRESSGKSSRDGQELPTKYDQAECFHTKHEPRHNMVPNHPFLVVPLPRSKNESL